ncbi:hypothetical protein CapIbe_009430 [Capra ibex]
MKRLAGTVLGLLFAHICFVPGLNVEQSPPALSLQEGASHMLRSNFSASVTNVQWYLQNPSGRLIHLFNVPSGTKQDGRLKATTIPTERRSSLHISSSQTADSGTCFCAAQHSAPQAPAASTQTLRGAGLSPSFSHSHTVRPPQGICNVDYFLSTLVQF